MLHQLVPTCRRVNVHFDYARVRSDPEISYSRVTRRLVAFEQDWLAHLLRRGFQCGDDLKIILQRLDRGHKNIENPVSRLRTHGRTVDPRRALEETRSEVEEA